SPQKMNRLMWGWGTDRRLRWGGLPTGSQRDSAYHTLFRRQRDKERAALPQLGLHTYPAAVSFEDLLGDGQSQSLTIARGGIQAVEDLKSLGLVFRRDADAIV